MLTEHNYTSWPGFTRPSKLLDCQREAVYLDGRVKPGHNNTRLISLMQQVLFSFRASKRGS